MTAQTFSSPTEEALPLHLVTKEDFGVWLNLLDETTRRWVEATGFSAAAGSVQILPSAEGAIAGAVGGLGSDQDRQRTRFLAAKVRSALPEGVYSLKTDHPERLLNEISLGWLLAGYTFGTYRAAPPPNAGLVAPDGVDAIALERTASAETLTRNLINTPANDMGPAELAEAARSVGATYDAQVSVIEGDDLIAAGFPLVHTVGRAATRAPRLIDMTWGDVGPKLTLVGKGVCFDTGGLNLKPGGSMALMKKDMGGAAHVIALARLVMQAALPVRLLVLVPAVENAIAGNAYRPGDVISTRLGKTVEIGNTDAEGRLILCDALTEAMEHAPDLVLDFATLTGAARVAMGPDIPPVFSNDPEVARGLVQAGQAVQDLLWELPLHAPYLEMMKSDIADLNNAGKGGFAGAITAALFLQEFVDRDVSWAHVDTFAWNPKSQPGRPLGGEALGLRAAFRFLQQRYTGA